MDRASVLDLFQLGNTPDFFHSALQSLGCMCCAPKRSKQYFTQHAGLTQWRSPRYEVPFVYGYIYISTADMPKHIQSYSITVQI